LVDFLQAVAVAQRGGLHRVGAHLVADVSAVDVVALRANEGQLATGIDRGDGYDRRPFRGRGIDRDQLGIGDVGVFGLVDLGFDVRALRQQERHRSRRGGVKGTKAHSVAPYLISISETSPAAQLRRKRAPVRATLSAAVETSSPVAGTT